MYGHEPDPVGTALEVAFFVVGCCILIFAGSVFLGFWG
jgi:hypothetical protein